MEVAFVVDNYSRCVIRTGFRSIDRAEEEGEAQYLIANYWSGSMIRLRRLIRPSLILYIRNYTPLNGDRHFRVKNYESNLSRRLFDSIRKFESTIIRWCRKTIVTVTFSFFLWPSHRDSKWINWRSNRGRDGGAASNDVYMAQITRSTIRGRDNRDDPFSFPAWLFYARRLFDEGQHSR